MWCVVEQRRREFDCRCIRREGEKERAGVERTREIDVLVASSSEDVKGGSAQAASSSRFA